MEKNISLRTRFLHLRVTHAEYAILAEECKATTCKVLSEYARRKLFDKPVVATVRDRSIDEMMYELIRLRKDLNSIIHTADQSENQALINNIIEMKALISKMGDKWLQ